LTDPTLIADTLAYRLTGTKHEHDGKLDNRLPGEPDVNDKDTWALRAKLLFTPSDRLDATLMLDTVREDNACCMPT
jgi:iron complex outermembrane receptor protein